MQVAGFPPNVRDAANALIMSLLNDPVPPEAKPYVDSPDHGSYAISDDHATVYYSLVGAGTIVISLVHPNT